MMKRLYLVLVLSIVLPALAAYDYSYEWGSEYDGGFKTTQVWTFDDTGKMTNVAFSPDVDKSLNLYGDPTIAIDYNYFSPSAGWAADWQNKTGVYYDMDGLSISLDIPNYEAQNPFKMVVLKVGMANAALVDPIVIPDPAADVQLISSDVEVGADGWDVLTVQWMILPNPINEMIDFSLLPDGGTTAVDWVAVHTVCVPEPASLALLMLGGSMLGLRRKK